MASKVPKHVAIILDGNRRYAKKLGLQPWKGHEYGLRKLEELFNWCMELGIKELTLYCFSTENFTRNKKEIFYLFNLFWKEFKNIKKSKGVYKNKIRINIIGRLNLFSKRMQDAMLSAMQKTRQNKKLTVNLALGYGGRQEITDAIRAIIKDVRTNKIEESEISEKLVSGYVYLSSEPDIVIRPGGEVRTSNFLTWQSAYSEWVFMKKLWPEFTKEDFVSCIDEFNARSRRFGT